MELINQFLDSNGDGSGTHNLNGNYSGGATEFWIECPASADAQYEISRLIVNIEDTAGMSAQEYGNLGAALTNGVKLEHRYVDDTVRLNLTPDPVQANADWSAYCYDAQVLSWGPGDEMLAVRWTFSKSGDFLVLEHGEKLVVILEDDLTGLISHRFLVQGHTQVS